MLKITLENEAQDFEDMADSLKNIAGMVGMGYTAGDGWKIEGEEEQLLYCKYCDNPYFARLSDSNNPSMFCCLGHEENYHLEGGTRDRAQADD